MSLHVFQLKVMAVETVGCGVVDFCGSNAFPVLELTAFFLVACKINILIVTVLVLQTRLQI